MLQLLALNFVLLPFSSVIVPMLRRRSRFGAICAINLSQGLTSVLVSVLLAWRGYGFMSMAWGGGGGDLRGAAAGLVAQPAGDAVAAGARASAR